MAWTLQGLLAGLGGQGASYDETQRQREQQNFLDEQRWKAQQDELARIEAEKNAKLGLITGAAEFEDKQRGGNLATLRSANPTAFNEWLNANVNANAAPSMPEFAGQVPSVFANMAPEQLGGLASLYQSSLTNKYGTAGPTLNAALGAEQAQQNLAKQSALGDMAFNAANGEFMDRMRKAKAMQQQIMPTDHGTMIMNPGDESISTQIQNPYTTESFDLKTGQKRTEQGVKLSSAITPTEGTRELMAERGALAKARAEALDMSKWGQWYVPPSPDYKPASELQDGKKKTVGTGNNAQSSILSKSLTSNYPFGGEGSVGSRIVRGLGLENTPAGSVMQPWANVVSAPANLAASGLENLYRGVLSKAADVGKYMVTPYDKQPSAASAPTGQQVLSKAIDEANAAKTNTVKAIDKAHSAATDMKPIPNGPTFTFTSNRPWDRKGQWQVIGQDTQGNVFIKALQVRGNPVEKVSRQEYLKWEQQAQR